MIQEIAASGPVPVDQAWRRYARPSLWPTWSPQLRSVQFDSEIGDGERRDDEPGDDELVAGATGRVHGPPGLWADFAVLSVDRAAHRWSWEVRRGPLRVRLDHAVQPLAGAEGSRTTLVLRGAAPVVVAYAPIAWYALHRLVTLPVEDT